MTPPANRGDRPLRVGASLPQTEIGNDPGAIRDFAQAVEAMGFDHLVIYDHVLGADPAAHGGNLLYSLEDAFHEPFVTLGFLAAVTTRLKLATGVLVLPQRQAALVAKQAAEVDVLSGGRLRLGVAVGWNAVEQQALGMDFASRGARIEEQIHVMRALWTQPSVTFHGRFHHLEAAGIRPFPVQRPIPIWHGGHADAVLRRIARGGDGWFPRMGPPTDAHRDQIDRLRRYAREAGRDPHAIDMEPHVNLTVMPPDEWAPAVDAWRALGAGHMFVSTMGGGFTTVDAHLQRFRAFRDALPAHFR